MSNALYNYVRIRVETVSTTETAVIRFKKQWNQLFVYRYV